MVCEPLRKIIKEQYKSESEFARKLGWTKQKLSKTILGVRSPKISDLNTLSRELEIPVDRIVSFFTQ